MENNVVDSNDIWFVLSRSALDGNFSVDVIPFTDENEAWEIISEEIDSPYSQSWLLTPKEYKNLKELLNLKSI